MKLKNIIAVSGHPTLMSLVSTRNNGLVLKDPATGKTNFFSVRSYQFTPLETVGIYTMTDTIELKEVFKNMIDQMSENPPVSHKAPVGDLMAYMAKILPDYDRDRVFPGDVKKLIKWFNNLNELNLLQGNDEEE